MTVYPLGDSAVVIVVGEGVDPGVTARAQAVAQVIERHRPAGVVDVVPAFGRVAVYFEPATVAVAERIFAALTACLERVGNDSNPAVSRRVEISVCYGGEHGPDLAEVAAHAGLSAEDVIRHHEGGEYLVHAIGFVPGFPYLGGLAPTLATPRRATPRTRVPPGAVGIGGQQTGVYPFATPGGWNLIGRTPERLFDSARPEPALLRPGDQVKFRAISASEFAERETHFHVIRENSAGAISSGDRTLPHVIRENHARIEVVGAGMFTTVQDRGRVGYRSGGLPMAGAADPFALRLANLLVGNPEDAAGLEITLVGPELRFSHDTLVALAGAEFAGVPRWEPFVVKGGAILKFGAARAGCRGYLAVAGGIAVAPILGSRSTYAVAAIGGVAGRALVKGDVLPVPMVRRAVGGRWKIDARILPEYSDRPTVRVVAGAHSGEVVPDWQSRDFRVSPRSDRMGLRLTGEPLNRRDQRELVSAPVVPGTVQLPPDGQPIVLLADAQTIGGYPQLGHVASVDLPLAAQLRPGDTVRFQSVTVAEAGELMGSRERALGLLREGLAGKLGWEPM